jgi:hypothetical protein
MSSELVVRTAGGETLVPVDSRHPFHADMFKTLDLLALSLADGSKLYFVVEGCTKFEDMDEVRSWRQHFYEEHTCPTNFIRIEAIVHNGDHDPHGVFEYVDTVWMTDAYVRAEEEGTAADYLASVFPQLGETPTASTHRNEKGASE